MSVASNQVTEVWENLRTSPLAESMLRSVWTCELASTSGKSSGMGQKCRCSPLHLHSENALHCNRCPCVRCHAVSQVLYLLMEKTWKLEKNSVSVTNNRNISNAYSMMQAACILFSAVRKEIHPLPLFTLTLQLQTGCGLQSGF